MAAKLNEQTKSVSSVSEYNILSRRCDLSWDKGQDWWVILIAATNF